MKSLMNKIGKLFLRLLAIILIGLIFAIFGFIVAANLAGLYELISSQPFVINGREGYESAGPIGFVTGALIGFVGSSFLLFRWRAQKTLR